MFWNDLGVKRRHARLQELPPVPETGWAVPREFPNLSNASVLSFDVETKEFDLDNGPGWARNTGHIVGVSIGAQDRLGNRGAWYFPVRHEVGGEDNLDSRNVFAFVKHALETPHVPKVGANLTYDMGHLAEENIFVQGQLNDVQFAEALIDSDAQVALEILGNKYVRRGKNSQLMYEWQRGAYPNTPETKRRGDIWRTPPKLVGFYAEDDAHLPLEVFERQRPILDMENLDWVYRLECDLIPLMISMRRGGVRVDVAKAERLLHELQRETIELYKRVSYEYGWNLSSTDSRQLGPLLEALQIKVPRNDPTERNPEGTFSVKKEWLAELEHPIGALLNDIREHEKICGTFLQSYIINKNINGYLYPQFHQLKGDENGTIVGRFASSDPNLQNIPSRTKLGKMVRECFIPDDGHSHWQKNDYSQVHYRILAHYAVDDGDGSADELRYAYSSNPKMDYHDNVYYNVCPFMGWDPADEDAKDFRRRPIKNVNFGLLYGQSQRALGNKTAVYFGQGFGPSQVQEFFDAYFDGAPYVKPTMKEIEREVQAFGYVTTIGGRRVRFSEWEPVDNDRREVRVKPLPYQAALREYGSPLKRAWGYRGVNYKFQGSEPDIMKEGMRKLWNSGVFDYIGVPKLTVHDELDFSIREGERYMGTNKKGEEVAKYRAVGRMREALDFVQHTMQQSIKLRVPLRVDESSGPNWGKAD